MKKYELMDAEEIRVIEEYRASKAKAKQEADSKQSALEEKFKAVLNQVNPQIQEQLNIAYTAMNKAEALSEEHGVPFQSKLTRYCEVVYSPKSIKTKWEEVYDDDDWKLRSSFEKDLGFYLGYGEGWNYSSIGC